MFTSIYQSVSSFIIAISNHHAQRTLVRNRDMVLVTETGLGFYDGRIFACREKSLWRKLNLINLL